MSFQDTLMNVVYLEEYPDVDDVVYVLCSWCDPPEIGWRTHLTDANNLKIIHENDHGIYLDPDTGEMYYDDAENSLMPAPIDDIPWGTPDSWIPDNPDENGMRMSDFI
jgi:hypothetical protein